MLIRDSPCRYDVLLSSIQTKYVSLMDYEIPLVFMQDGLFQRFVGPLIKEMKAHLSDITSEGIIRKHKTFVSLKQASEWSL